MFGETIKNQNISSNEQKGDDYIFLCILVMAESQVKSREAKVHFDEDVLEGKKA